MTTMPTVAAVLGEATKHHQAGRFEDAERLYRDVLRTVPNHPDALHQLGALAIQFQKHDVAIEHITRAISWNPEQADYRYHLALAYHEQGNLATAIMHYREAVRLDETKAAAWNNLGNVFRSEGRVDDAVLCYRRVVELKPNDSASAVSLGRALKDQARVPEAIEQFAAAVRHDPACPQAHSHHIFARQYVPGVTAERLHQAHKKWDAACGISKTTQPRSKPGQKLRVGFVSPDLGYHPVGLFLAPLVERIDSQRMTTVCYSSREKFDAQSDRIRQAVDQWHDVLKLSDEELTDKIRDDRIDILFDLAGHTDNNRLPVFARRAAPVQITWAGYVGTTGLAEMDCLLADGYHVPSDAGEFYSERVLRMPHGYIVYEPPSYAPSCGPPPASTAGHFTFGCFNNPSKLNEHTLSLWADIMRQLPESRLMLKYKGFDQNAIQSWLAEFFRGCDIAPNRIVCLGNTTHVRHLEAYRQVDIALDPIPYSSGLTACECLLMGVPLVTTPGSTFAGRHAFSHLSNAGFTESIASDETGYVKRAVELARDLPRLTEIRETLRDRLLQSPLCDMDRYANDWCDVITRVAKESQ